MNRGARAAIEGAPAAIEGAPAAIEGAPATWGFALWRAALEWQRAVNAALRPLGLSHTHFLVLDAAANAILDQDDAVPQFAVAESAGLDRPTISKAVRKLEARGLLDRDVDSLDGRRWRVLLTPRGHKVLARATALVAVTACEEVPRLRAALSRSLP